MPDNDPYDALFTPRDPNREALADPRVKGFLDKISQSEGADYNTLVGGRRINDLSRHPNIVGLTTKAGPSTAFGRYQITGSTNRSKLAKYKDLDYSPENQDLRAVELLRQTKALDALQQGDEKTAIQRASREWASLPGSPLPGRKNYAAFQQNQDPYDALFQKQTAQQTPQPATSGDPYDALFPQGTTQSTTPALPPIEEALQKLAEPINRATARNQKRLERLQAQQRATQPQNLLELPATMNIGGRQVPTQEPYPTQQQPQVSAPMAPSAGILRRRKTPPVFSTTITPEQQVRAQEQADNTEVPRKNQIRQQLLNERPMLRYDLGTLDSTVNQKYQEQLAAERKQSEQEPQIADLTEKYREAIRGLAQAGQLGPDASKWATEALASGAGQLSNLAAGALRYNLPVRATQALLGGRDVGRDADTIELHAQAMQRAAQLEGADRNAASKFAQEMVAGTIGSLPELAAMTAGVPAPAAFGVGSATRAIGRGATREEIGQEAIHGMATAVPFEIPVSKSVTNLARRIAIKAGLVAEGTTGIELAGGAPPEQAAKSGLTNALYAVVGEIQHARTPADLDTAVAKVPESLRNDPEVRQLIDQARADVREAVDRLQIRQQFGEINERQPAAQPNVAAQPTAAEQVPQNVGEPLAVRLARERLAQTQPAVSQPEAAQPAEIPQQEPPVQAAQPTPVETTAPAQLSSRPLTQPESTPANVERFRGPNQNLPLTSEGVEQANSAADNLKRLGLQNATVSAPDMERNLQTAKTIADRTGGQLVTDDRFRDWDHALGGELVDDQTLAVRKRAAENPTLPPTYKGRTGEPVNDFTARVVPAARETLERAESTGQPQVVTANFSVIKAIQSALKAQDGRLDSNKIDAGEFLKHDGAPGEAHVLYRGTDGRLKFDKFDLNGSKPLPKGSVLFVRHGATEYNKIPSRAEPTAPASVPFMITRQMETDLRARGMTQAQINRLTPQQAHDVLAQPTPAEAASPERPTVLRAQGEDRGGIIAPSPTDPNLWRLTRFDAQGFSGHADYRTREEALRDAQRTYRFTEPMSEQEFTNMASTEKFAAGNELTQYVNKPNLTPEDQQRMAELNRVISGEPVKPVEQVAPTPETKQPTIVDRENGGFFIQQEGGSLIVRDLGDGNFEANEIRVDPAKRRQGVATKLFEQAAREAQRRGGRLLTSPELTDAGRATIDSLWKKGNLGGRERVAGASRHEIFPATPETKPVEASEKPNQFLDTQGVYQYLADQGVSRTTREKVISKLKADDRIARRSGRVQGAQGWYTEDVDAAIQSARTPKSAPSYSEQERFELDRLKARRKELIDQYGNWGEKHPAGRLIGGLNPAAQELFNVRNRIAALEAKGRKTATAIPSPEVKGEPKGASEQVAAPESIQSPTQAAEGAEVPSATDARIAALEKKHAEAAAKLEALGPEPPKPSSEKQRFGKLGREGASPEDVARYDAEKQAHNRWKRKAGVLKRAEVDAANALEQARTAIENATIRREEVAVRKEKSLTQRIRKLGGIDPKDLMGEYQNMARKEGGPRAVGIVKRGGRTEESMAQALAEEGYGQGDWAHLDPAQHGVGYMGTYTIDLGRFREAIREDLAGQKHYSTENQDVFEAKFAREEAKYYADQQAQFEADQARDNFLMEGRGADLFDKVRDGKASDAEQQEFNKLATEAGISEAEIQNLIDGSRAEVAGLETVGGERGRTAGAEAKPAEVGDWKVEPPKAQLTAKEREMFDWAESGAKDVLGDENWLRDNPDALTRAGQVEDIRQRLEDQAPDVFEGVGSQRVIRSLVSKLEKSGYFEGERPTEGGLRPITIPDEKGYGYKVVHLTTREDTPKYQITRFDENGTPVGHDGEPTLAGALREAGYFRKQVSDAARWHEQYVQARSELKDTPLGDYAYVSYYRPFSLGWNPLGREGIVYHNVGDKGVVFSDKPLPVERQEKFELAPVSTQSLDAYIKERTANEFGAAERPTKAANRPAQQLGFVDEGLTMQEAPRPQVTDQRAQLVADAQARRSATESESVLATRRLAEIQRRGLTVDDYAKQPTLTGELPSAKEIQLLKALENEPKVVREKREELAKLFDDEGKRLKKFGSGGPDTQEMIDRLIVKGWEFYAEHKPKFEDWAIEMRQQFGGKLDKLESHLRDAYEAITGQRPQADLTKEQVAEIRRPIRMSETTAPKDVAMQKDRELAGLPELEQVPHVSSQEVLDKAVAANARDQRATDVLIEQALRGGKNYNNVETMQVNLRGVELKNRIERLTKEISATADPRVVLEKGAEQDVLLNEFDKLSTAMDLAGAEWSRAGMARQRALKEDYSLAAMVARVKKDYTKVGADFTEKALAEVKDLNRRLEEAEAREKKVREELEAKQSQEGTESFVQEQKVKLRPRGRRSRSDLLNERANLKKDLSALIQAPSAKAFFKSELGEFDIEKAGELSRLLRDLARNYIEDGVMKAEDVLDKVHAEVKDISDLTRREVSDLISGYGRISNATRDPIERKLNEVKAILAATSGKQDVLEEAIRPLRRGQQRQKPSEDQRRALRELNEAMREKGPELAQQPYDESIEQATPLDKAKSTARNRIEQLRTWIASGKKEVEGRTQIIPDVELIRLRTERDALEKVARLLNDPAADQKAIERRVEQLNRIITENKAKIASGNVAPVTKEGARALWTPEIGKLEQERVALNEQVGKLRAEEAKRQREAAAATPDAQAKAREEAIAKRLKSIDKQIADIQNGRATQLREGAQGVWSPEISEAERRLAEARAMTGLTKGNEKLRAQIQAGGARPEPAQGAKSIWTREIGEAQKERDALNKVLGDIRTETARTARQQQRQQPAGFYGAEMSWADFEKQAKSSLTRLKQIEKQKAEYERRMREGDFSPKAQRPAPTYTRELLAARKEVEQIKLEYNKMRYKVLRNGWQQAWDITKQAASVPKTLKSMADVSAMFRQGGYYAVTHPYMGLVKPTREMMRSFSELGWRNVEDKIKNDDAFAVLRKGGVEFTGVDKADPNLSKHEESYFGGDLIDLAATGKYNILGKTVKLVKDVSERTFVSFLDAQRLYVGRTLLEGIAEQHKVSMKAIENALIKPETGRTAQEKTLVSEVEAISKLVNAGTGRGSLGKRGNELAPALNIVMFSPRLLASRVRLLNNMVNPVTMALMYRKSPVAAKAMIKDNVKFLAATTVMLGLARRAGATVSMNPDDAEFLKIRVGNTVYDTLAGLQQPLRYIMNMARGLSEGETYPGEALLPMSARFARSKLNPALSPFVNRIVGSDFEGRKFSWAREAKEMAIPLPMKDVIDGLREGGIIGGLAALPTVTGVGVGSYPAKAEVPSTTAEKLARKFVRQNMPESQGREEEEIATNQAASRLRERSRHGEDVTADIKALGANITDRQVKKILAARNRTRLQEDVDQLGPKEAIIVYSQATPAQKQEIRDLVQDASKRIATMNPAQAADVKQRYEAQGFKWGELPRPKRPTERPTRPQRPTREGFLAP